MECEYIHWARKEVAFTKGLQHCLRENQLFLWPQACLQLIEYFYPILLLSVGQSGLSVRYFITGNKEFVS